MKKGRKNTKRKKSARRQKRMLAIAGLVFICLFIIFGIIYFVLRSRVNSTQKDVTYNNVYIETVNVSGMKKNAAVEVLRKKEAEYQKQNIVLNVEDKNITLSLEELGFSFKNPEKCAEEAVSYGKKGSVFSRYSKVRKLKKNKQVIPVVYQIDKEKTKKVFEEQAQPLEHSAENASIRHENNGFVITDAVEGKKIDAKASIKAIEKYLNKKWKRKDASVDLVSITDKPKIKREDLESIDSLLGTFTTYCGTGGGRVQNVESGTGHINGAIIMPGEEYSADAAMRPYTEENGFTEAGSYESGKVVQTMGGGICQVSSTLYNALILAEIEITERYPHSMLVDYVEPSMDAAIAGDVKDLKFKNNTETPIYLEGYVSGGNLTFNVYGKETRSESRTIQYVSETLSSEEAGKEFQESDSPIGTIEKAGSGHVGKQARLWKVVYENGQEVSRDVFNNSSYRSSPSIVNVGTATDNAEAAALVKAAIATQDEAQINAAIEAAKAKIAEAAQKASQQQAANSETPASTE